MCTHTHRHKHSILCLVMRWAVPVLILPHSRAAHSGHKVVPHFYHCTQTASRSTHHSLSMLSLCWSSCCTFMLCPRVGLSLPPCAGAAAPRLSGSILVVSGLHQEGLQVLTLQQGPSFLWLCLFQGFIAIWDWFPELDCLHPITWSSDCCQILSLWDNFFNNSCVLRGRRTKRRI